MAIAYQVKGKVQGVGFRNYVEKWAGRLDINGWVRNVGTDIVEVCISPCENQTRFEEYLRRGPMMSKVKKVVIMEVADSVLDGLGPCEFKRKDTVVDGIQFDS